MHKNSHFCFALIHFCTFYVEKRHSYFITAPHLFIKCSHRLCCALTGPNSNAFILFTYWMKQMVTRSGAKLYWHMQEKRLGLMGTS